MRGLCRVLSGPSALAAAAADLVALSAEQAIGARGRFTLGLAGGSTPKAAYSKLAAEPFVSRVDWGRTQIFFGDERCVAPDHPDSNFRMANEALLSKVPVPSANVFRMRGEAEDREAAAREYEAALRTGTATTGEAMPVLDLVLLGLGPDGHTASLFPGTDALDESVRAVVPVFSESKGTWRLTITRPVLDAARRVAVLVAGLEKREMLARALADVPAPGDERLPIRLLAPERLLWLVDREAGG